MKRDHLILAVGAMMLGGLILALGPTTGKYITGDVCLTGITSGNEYWSMGSCGQGAYTSLPLCRTEDDIPAPGQACLWDARNRGNGSGTSIIVIGG